MAAYAVEKRTESDIVAGQMTQRVIKLHTSYLRDSVAAERTIQEAFSVRARSSTSESQCWHDRNAENHAV